MKTCKILLLILLIASSNIKAQDQKPILKVADEYYNRFEYNLAIPLYEKLAKNDKVKTILLEKLANSYKQVNNYPKAAYWYAIVVSKQDAQPSNFLAYGDVLKNLGDYKKAKDIYQMHPNKELKNVSTLIMSCDSALYWQNHPTGDKVKNIDAVNTSASEWGAVLNKQKNLVFTSDSLRKSLILRNKKKEKKEITKLKYGWTNRPHQKIYSYDSTAQQGKGKIIEFSKTLNNSKYHLGPIIFSKDYQIAYFTVTNPTKFDKKTSVLDNQYYTRRLEIFISKFQNDEWQKPIPFSYNNPKFSVGHPVLNEDESILYFMSDMPGGKGKTDIWYSEKQADGSWSKPINCGENINTWEEEAFPTVGQNGVLYFASKGLIGMGGFDIFSTKGSKANWSKPVNLKSPLNSSADDFFLTMQDSENGYFASNRLGGKGDDDIYAYQRKKQEPLLVTKPIITTPKLHDSILNQPKKEIPPLVDKPKIVEVKPKPVPADVVIGKAYVVYYDFNKFNIRGDASLVLDELAALMNKYPNLTVKLSSYTDARGSNAYNLSLSKKRAIEALTYLVNKGVSEKRIIFEGYGKASIAIKCPTGDVKCIENEHQRNRRTEVTIYSF